MTYLVDSDVLIQAKNRHYGFDLCPGFWDWLDSAHTYQRVFSVARVRDELRAGSDELAEWASVRSSFFLAPDDAVVENMRSVAAWATSATPPYTAAAITQFLDAADYYLVAHARAKGFIVVTAEIAADTVTKVKIPNACQAMGVSYVDVFTMLRTEGVRFVLP